MSKYKDIELEDALGESIKGVAQELEIAFKSCKWRWHDGYPDAERIARELCQSVDSGGYSSGGLTVEKRGDSMILLVHPRLAAAMPSRIKPPAPEPLPPEPMLPSGTLVLARIGGEQAQILGIIER